MLTISAFTLTAGMQFAAVLLASRYVFGKLPDRIAWQLPIFITSASMAAQVAWAFAQPHLQVSDWILLYATFPWPLMVPPLFACLKLDRHR